MNAIVHEYQGVALKEGEHYRVIKDGNNNEHHVAIVSHHIFAPQVEGKVILEARRKDMERIDSERNSRFRRVNDKATGLIFGLNPTIDALTKQITFRRIPMGAVLNFDLSNPQERIEWACISRATNVEGSPNQDGTPQYRVINSEKKAATGLERRANRKKAIDIAESLGVEEMRGMALNLGINPDAYTHITLQYEFLEMIEKGENWKKFMDVWEAGNREIITLFKRAEKCGIITWNPSMVKENNTMKHMGFYYNGIHLGATDQQAIAYMSEPTNSTLVGSINTLTIQREKDMKEGKERNEKLINSAAVNKESNGPSVADIKAEYEAKIAGMKADMELMKKEAGFERNESPKDKTNAPSQSNQEEYQALKAEAKALKIPGYQFIKITDVGKLKEKILEKKAQLA